MPDQNQQSIRTAQTTCSLVLPDGSLVEMIHDRTANETGFLVGQGDTVVPAASVELGSSFRAVPYSPRNNLLTHDVILLASGAQEYGTDEELLADVRAFIHRYCDVSDGFEEIAAHYVVFTWIYDLFNEVPYLRVRGDFGSGKSRFLLTAGSLCYKPIFASGASTVSPLFRILDAFRGTLVMDESDFRLSDERAEVIKILNNGNAHGFPVLRSEATPTKEYNPRAFHVFGPKIIASRGHFADRALESRCITEEMGRRAPRAEIPLNLPPEFNEEALLLRNKLLLFRFRNRGKPRRLVQPRDQRVEPRISQIFAPLIATMSSPLAKERLYALARRYSNQLAAERSMTLEAQLLEIIHDLLKTERTIAVKDVADKFAEMYGAEYRRPITPRWIGGLLRKRLSLGPVKSHGTFVIPASDQQSLSQLFARYSIATDGDIGDVGDVDSAVEADSAA